MEAEIEAEIEVKSGKKSEIEKRIMDGNDKGHSRNRVLRERGEKKAREWSANTNLEIQRKIGDIEVKKAMLEVEIELFYLRGRVRLGD